MAEPALKRRWQATQSAWDDSDFLATAANAFMKRRWRRLERRVAALCAAESARLGRGLDLVDVGCGRAGFEAWARPHLASYTGLESSSALLPRSRSEGRAFRLLRGQAESLPLPAASADLVLFKEVLDHCWGPLEALRQARRVLRPGGLVLLTLTNDAAWYKALLPGAAARIKAGQHDHLHFFSPPQVLELLARAGFGSAGSADSHYLRLPRPLEQALGRLPEACSDALIAASDAAGALALPGAGGSFWAWGRKPARGGRA